MRDEINTPVTAKRLKTILETFPKSAKQDVAQGFSYGLEMVAEAPRTITISRKHFGSQSGELGVTPGLREGPGSPAPPRGLPAGCVKSEEPGRRGLWLFVPSPGGRRGSSLPPGQ